MGGVLGLFWPQNHVFFLMFIVSSKGVVCILSDPLQTPDSFRFVRCDFGVKRIFSNFEFFSSILGIKHGSIWVDFNIIF